MGNRCIIGIASEKCHKNEGFHWLLVIKPILWRFRSLCLIGPIIEHLRASRKDIADMKENDRTLTMRLASIETKLAHMHSDDVNQIHQMDNLRDRLERIEQRLDLYDPTPEH